MPGAQLDEQAPDVAALSTIAEVEAALKFSHSLTAEIEQRLESQLTLATTAASSRALTLTSAAQLAAAISDDAEELTSLLSSAARLSDSTSSRIRQLDTLLERGNSALAWADDILTLRVCAEGAKTSLSAADLAGAAKHVQRYLQLGEDVRNDPASASAISQITQSMEELSRKVRSNCDSLLDANISNAQDGAFSAEKAIEAVQLFVPIGEQKEGLERLANHLKKQVAIENDNDIRSLLLDAVSEGDAPGGVDEPHIVTLGRLFEAIAAYVHDCQEPVTALFGTESMAYLTSALQQQCDSCCGRVLSRYIEARRVDQILRAIRSETANARDLDALLNEFTLLSQRMSAYVDFLIQKSSLDDVKAASHLAEGERLSLKEIISSMLDSSQLNVRRRELAGNYEAFESYFMRENARLAIQIDESNGEDAETSTAVDDFFFVMQKCFQRAFAFGDTNADVLKVVLQQVSKCLVNDLLAYMRRRLRETETALEKMLRGSAATSSLPAAAMTVSFLKELAKANISIPGGPEAVAQEGDVAKYDFFVALNNASVSAEYATRLRANIEKVVHASPKLSEDDRALLAAPVAQITDASRALVLASEHGVSRLAAVLLGRITATVDSSLAAASYVVSETEYTLDSDATPSFSREMADEIESKVLSSSLEKRLTEKNWDALVRQVAEWFANKVETIVFLNASPGASKPFNAFGGLRVDRDVRAISAYFSEKSRRSTVRDVFGRLSQLAMVVNLERPAEIYDIWGPNAGGMTWRLAPNEVRRTLGLRVDFTQDAVRALKL